MEEKKYSIAQGKSGCNPNPTNHEINRAEKATRWERGEKMKNKINLALSITALVLSIIALLVRVGAL